MDLRLEGIWPFAHGNWDLGVKAMDPCANPNFSIPMDTLRVTYSHHPYLDFSGWEIWILNQCRCNRSGLHSNLSGSHFEECNLEVASLWKLRDHDLCRCGLVGPVVSLGTYVTTMARGPSRTADAVVAPGARKAVKFIEAMGSTAGAVMAMQSPLRRWQEDGVPRGLENHFFTLPLHFVYNRQIHHRPV